MVHGSWTQAQVSAVSPWGGGASPGLDGNVLGVTDGMDETKMKRPCEKLDHETLGGRFTAPRVCRTGPLACSSQTVRAAGRPASWQGALQARLCRSGLWLEVLACL